MSKTRERKVRSRENCCAWDTICGGGSVGAIRPSFVAPTSSLTFCSWCCSCIWASLTARVGRVSVPTSPRPPVPPALESGPRVPVRCPRRACRRRRRRRRGPGFAGGRSCISSAVHRSVLLALSPSDPSRSSAGRPTGSERSPAGTPLLTSSCWDPATFPAKPGFIMCLCSAAPAAGSGGGEPATTKKTGAQGRLAGGPAPAGAWRSRGAAAAAAAREDGSPAAACSSSSSAASPLSEPLAHGGS